MRSLFCALAGILLVSGFALADKIECPSGVRYESTKQAPNWWWTPEIVRPKSAEYQVVGAELYLVCTYEIKVGTGVNHKLPQGTTCKARRGGFDCNTRPIECPAGPFMTQITLPQPSSWTQTPVKHDLITARVASATYLMCDYSDVVRSYSLRTRVCTLQGSGFDCTLPKR